MHDRLIDDDEFDEFPTNSDAHGPQDDEEVERPVCTRRRIMFAGLTAVLAGVIVAATVVAMYRRSGDQNTPCPIPAQAGSSVVALSPAGAFKGQIQSDSTSLFAGIRYAQSPTGYLRFAPPVPVTPQPNKIFPALNFGKACLQLFTNMSQASKYSEDCLFLNVYAPSAALSSADPDHNCFTREIDPTAKLPVMVWIYGGGFYAGAGDVYPGGPLSASGSVVVVTFNYRLGPFGFGVTEGIAEESGPLNFGLLDQRLALQWVSQNIAAFGGDPTRVTIFGESAGGGSVQIHLTMPESYPLFSRAISQSAGGSGDHITRSQAIARGALLENATGCDIGSPTQRLACLRGLPALTILFNTASLIPMFPVVDGDPKGLPLPPLVAFATGASHPTAAIMIGHMAAEGNFLAGSCIATVTGSFSTNISDSLYHKCIQSSLFIPNATVTQQMIGWYSSFEQDHGKWAALSNWTSDYLIDCPSIAALRGLVSHTRPAQANVFAYYWTKPLANWVYASEGATHFADVPFLFPTCNLLNATISGGDVAFSAEIMKYWTTFAATGDPNPTSPMPQTVRWPEFNGAFTDIFRLDTPSAPIADSDKSKWDFCRAVWFDYFGVPQLKW